MACSPLRESAATANMHRTDRAARRSHTRRENQEPKNPAKGLASRAPGNEPRFLSSQTAAASRGYTKRQLSPHAACAASWTPWRRRRSAAVG